MNSKYKRLLLIAAVCIFIGSVIYMTVTYDHVPGADEKVGGVVEKYAQKVGVSEREPLINTDKGDILLFLFCFGGLVSGFYLGYQWRKIICESPEKQKSSVNEDHLKACSNGKE